MRILLILILFVSTSFAGSWRRSAAVPAAAGVTFIINEDFEGAGTPASWFTGGSDFDSTASPLVGAQSLRTNASYAQIQGLNNGELHMKVRVRVAGGTASQMMVWEDAGFSQMLAVYVQATGEINLTDNAGGTGVYQDTTGQMTGGTAYDMWVDYTKGTGSNGVIAVGFATAGGAKPSSGANYASGSTAVSSANIDHINLKSSSAVNIDWDSVQLAATPF